MVLGLGHWLSQNGKAPTLIAAVSLIWIVIMVPRLFQRYAVALEFTMNQLVGIAKEVEQRVPNNEIVLLRDVGYVPWAVNRLMVDIFGLKAPGVVLLHEQSILVSRGQKRPEVIAKLRFNMECNGQ